MRIRRLLLIFALLVLLFGCGPITSEPVTEQIGSCSNLTEEQHQAMVTGGLALYDLYLEYRDVPGVQEAARYYLQQSDLVMELAGEFPIR